MDRDDLEHDRQLCKLCLPFTIYLFTVYYLVYYLPFTVYYLLFTIYYLLFTAYCLLYTVYCLLFTCSTVYAFMVDEPVQMH